MIQHGTNELCKISLLVCSAERDRGADGGSSCLVAVLETPLTERDCTALFCFALQVADGQ